MGRVVSDSGQSLVEFALIAVPLFMLTVGLVGVGQYFYEYNAMASAATVAARWASVVGGTCYSSGSEADSSADWCNQFNSGSTSPPSGGWAHAPSTKYPVFWQHAGNWPLQGSNVSCPTSYSSAFTGYYTASQFSGNTSATIVGSVAQRLDTTSSSSQSSPLIVGGLVPGFDLSQLRVCIQPTWDTSTTYGTDWQFGPGYKLTVYLYYPFDPIGGILKAGQMEIVASSTYETE